jgi:hypothetical protein
LSFPATPSLNQKELLTKRIGFVSSSPPKKRKALDNISGRASLYRPLHHIVSAGRPGGGCTFALFGVFALVILRGTEPPGVTTSRATTGEGSVIGMKSVQRLALLMAGMAFSTFTLCKGNRIKNRVGTFTR